MDKSKKTFDPTIMFNFFGSWVTALESLETEADKHSQAYSLFKAIAYYSMYDVEPDYSDDPVLRAIWAVIAPEADNSIERRSRGFEREQTNATHQAIVQAIKSSPTMSTREVAKTVGTSKSTVDRVKRQYIAELQEATPSTGCSAGDLCDYSLEEDIEEDNYEDTGAVLVGNSVTAIGSGTVTTGRDSGTPAVDPFADLDDDGELPF